MGLSYDYDCASSILLCAEDNESILGFDDEEEGGYVHDHDHGISWLPEPQSTDFYVNPLMGSFPLQSDECLDLLLEREADHLPKGDYAERLLNGSLDPSMRRDAIDWMSKVHAYYSFGPLSAYLSVNYLDRFLAVYELPQGKAWMTQLLSVAFLSLAAKMEETEVPLALDLQVGESKYVFEAKTIQRMELLVLSTLKWRMQAITPFSYIDYFLHQFNDGDSPWPALIYRSVEFILSVIKGIEFLFFRPSEIAAAVALSVLEECQMVTMEKAVACCKHVDKERLLRCYEVIQKVVLMINRPPKNSGPSVSSMPMSPNGVLDAACLSDHTTLGSQASSCPPLTPIKRRKISGRTFVS